MSIYIFFLIVLFALAISDLMVGVANDAVNFLNSAIGSKVARRKVVLIIASLGVLAGALLSNGMMEVARKGLIMPQYFLFTEIIIIFMAVMFTDVLLLDFFNTFGLPTSTTVSLVFGLLGASVGAAWLKTTNGDLIIVDGVQKVAQVGDFINSSNALIIISSILLSVVISFVFGIVIQWFSRLLFSFNIEKTIKYYGAIWGGIGIAAITYFILIKGLKDSSFMTKENYEIIRQNTLLIIGGSFVFWSFVLQLLVIFFKINPLKIVVLAGTFALAMAFAGNDLVNFIGVPLAGYESFKLFVANGYNDLLMVGLLNEIKTPIYFLVLAGIIMVTVLWVSKKARTVTETELKLSRQDEGNERFGSSAFSRYLVRNVIKLNYVAERILPQSMMEKINSRFDNSTVQQLHQFEPDPPMFDLVRAAVNMMVAAILISVGTSYKIPLSTTYVTFIVAMSTSLVDGAWGRDSAVYRITGVFTVIGGWFVTGLAAFMVAFLLSLFMGWTQIVGVVALVLFAIFAFYKSNITHNKREEKVAEEESDDQQVRTAPNLIVQCNSNNEKSLKQTGEIYRNTVNFLIKENRKELKKQLDRTIEIEAKLDKKSSHLNILIPDLNSPEMVEASHFYVLSLDYQREITHCENFLIKQIYNHVDNNHKPVTETQARELSELNKSFAEFIEIALAGLTKNNVGKLEKLQEKQEKILGLIKEIRKNLIRQIRKNEIGVKNSVLILGLLSETRNIMIYVSNLIKIHFDYNKAINQD
jgi:phosphate/sulfate permease